MKNMHGKCMYVLLFFILFQQVAVAQNNNNKNVLTEISSNKKASVAPFNDTIFYVYSRIGSFSAQDRAHNIEKRIVQLADDYRFEEDSLAVLSLDNVLEVMYEDIVIMSITESDARCAQKSQSDLAAEYKEAIRNAVKEERSKNAVWTVLKQIGLILLLFFTIFFLVKYTARLFRLLNKKIIELKGTRLKGLKIKNYDLIDEKRAVRILLFTSNILKFITIAMVLYLAIPILFSIFPGTRGIADSLFGYILNPLLKILKTLINYIPNLITIIVVIFVFRYLLKGIYFFAKEIEDERLNIKGFYSDWAIPTYNIIKVLLYVFMFIIIFPYLPGSTSPIFQGVSVFLGLILSLGSTTIINNLVSGFILTYMRPFKVNDHIQFDDISGFVVEKTPFVVRVRTHKNEITTIPNSKILNSHTVNYTESSQKNKLILYSTISIGYEIHWKRVHELLMESANRTTHVLKNPKPFILQKALNDNYIEYQINVYTVSDHLMARIYSELYQHIIDVFNEAGIEIMSPQYHAVRDGNDITIPPGYNASEMTATSSKENKAN